MEVIKNDDTLDKGFGLVRDKVLVQTLKFGFRVGILLGEGDRVVGMRRGIARKTQMMMAVHIERNELVFLYACGSD